MSNLLTSAIVGRDPDSWSQQRVTISHIASDGIITQF
jgi:hypothetical protein